MKHLLAVCPFVVNEEVRQVVPHLAVLVQVGHGGLQGGLQGLPVVLKEPQDCAPHQGSQQREGVLPGLGDVALLHSQPGQSEQDPGQQVHDNLAVDGIVVTKHQPAPNAGCKEGMKWDFLPLQPGLHCQEPFVGEHKIGQVPGVSVRGLGNGFQLLP